MKQFVNGHFPSLAQENMQENMKNSIIYGKGFGFSQFSNDVTQICKPLFDFLEIHHFSMRRFYRNGKHLYLCTDAAWVEHYFNQKYYNYGQFENFLGFAGSSYQLWRDWPTYDQCYLNLLNDVRKNFNFDNGLTVVKNHGSYLDVYTLATTRDNESINSVYLANFDIIEKFINYFLDISNSLIFTIEQEKYFNLPCINRAWESEIIKEHRYNIEKFHNQIGLQESYPQLLLSQREEECLFYLARGKTAKHIARLLGISHRTVETHILHIKSKLKCHTKNQLIEKAFDSGLVYFMPNSLTTTFK